MPSGNVDKPVIEDNRDGTVSIRYDPREEGLHELALKYNGEHVSGIMQPNPLHLLGISDGVFFVQVHHSSSTLIPFHLVM
jgi:filamin